MIKRFKKRIDIHRQHIQILILAGLIVLALIILLTNRYLDQVYRSQPVSLGLSYSPEYAESLGLEPRQVYREILRELNPKLIRISAYWNEIEPKKGHFDFSEVDYYLNEAEANKSKVLLAVGFKLPRWPECRAPKWVDAGDTKQRQAAQLEMVNTVINYYKSNQTIYAWQIENEPLFPFGECPKADKDFLAREVALVRHLSPKPIVLTDAGELSLWNNPMSLSDIFGTTLYRIIHDRNFGQLPYPLQPWYYRLKSAVIRIVFAPDNQKTIISELQAEPWATQFIGDLPLEEQINRFPVMQLTSNIEFARRVGFEEIYLWGAEWWYWMMTQGHPEYWNTAKDQFAK